jgi:chitodextrinase
MFQPRPGTGHIIPKPTKAARHHAPAALSPRFEPLETRVLLAGDGLAGAYFARTNHTADKFARLDQTVDFDWLSGTPAKSLGTDGFSVRWAGKVLAKFSESHDFVLTSSGGAKLWINKTLVIDAWSGHSTREDQGSIGLKAGKTYNIRIDYWSNGVDPEVKLEWQSNRLARSVVPKNRLYAAKLDSKAPSTPSRLRSTFVSSERINLAWDASSDPSGVIAYDVFVNNAKVATTAPGKLSYSRTGLSPKTDYSFSIQAVDAAGNQSSKATTAITTAAVPNDPPSTPSNLRVTGTTDSSISLDWDAATDDKGVTGYRIYRNGVKLNVAPTGTSFTDSGLSANTTYTYTVRSADGGGLFSSHSGSVSGKTDAVATHDAFAGMDGADFDQHDGVSVSGDTITNLDDGDWVRFRNVNFGGGARSVFFELSLPASNRGGWIELHLDTVSGPLIGKHNVQPTGSFDTFRTQQVNVTTTSGEHDLYVVFKGRSGVANLRNIQFKTQKLIRIMPLGDSITHQANDSESYRFYLWQQLQNAGFDVDFVGGQMAAYDGEPPNYDFDQNHEGHANKRADEIRAGVRAWAEANVPDIVLLHAGTNDIRQGQGAQNPIDDISNIISILREVNPSVKILLAQLIPSQGFESEINQFNSLVPALASSTSTSESPVIVVNQNSGFSLADTFDGTHPNSSGDQKMAGKWMDALDDIL